MEAVALYTFARKRNKPVLCLAQVTNTMGLAGQDFEKGQADGTADALMILDALGRHKWLAHVLFCNTTSPAISRECAVFVL